MSLCIETQNTDSSLGLFFFCFHLRKIFSNTTATNGFLWPQTMGCSATRHCRGVKLYHFFWGFASQQKRILLGHCFVKSSEGKAPLSRERVHFGVPIQMHSCACPSGLLHIFWGAAVLFSIFGGRSPPQKKNSWWAGPHSRKERCTTLFLLFFRNCPFRFSDSISPENEDIPTGDVKIEVSARGQTAPKSFLPLQTLRTVD